MSEKPDLGFKQYPTEKKSKVNKWIKIGVPVLILVVLVAVLAGVFGSRAAKKQDSNRTANSDSAATSEANAQSSIRAELGRFATATDEYFLPVYPSTVSAHLHTSLSALGKCHLTCPRHVSPVCLVVTKLDYLHLPKTNSAAFGDPTFIPAQDATLKWPTDDFVQTSPSFDNLRPSRPRLLAPKYKWDALPDLIKQDPYLKGWDDIIMKNASYYASLPLVVHVFDGGPAASGILDPAREVKLRVKHFSYAYRRTNDTQWVDRLWRELQVCLFRSPQIILISPFIRMPLATAPRLGEMQLINGTPSTSWTPQNSPLHSPSLMTGCTTSGRLNKGSRSSGPSSTMV